MASHEFQLVLQLPADCPLEDLGFEDDIAEAVGDEEGGPHFVDGHSSGAGTIEFFVHTDDPRAAFELCRPLLGSAGLLGMVVAAHRRFSGGGFTVIWPAGHTGVFKP